jgi:hypothetical protein
LPHEHCHDSKRIFAVVSVHAWPHAAGGESNFTDAHFGNTTSIFLSGFYFTP